MSLKLLDFALVLPINFYLFSFNTKRLVLLHYKEKQHVQISSFFLKCMQIIV